MQKINGVSIAEQNGSQVRVARLYTNESGEFKAFEKTLTGLKVSDVPKQYIEKDVNGTIVFVKNTVSVEYSGKNGRWILPTEFDRLIAEHVSLNNGETKESFV